MKTEIWLVIDEDGNIEVGTTRDDAVERYVDNIGEEEFKRLVRLSLDIDDAALKPITMSAKIAAATLAKCDVAVG